MPYISKIEVPSKVNSLHCKDNWLLVGDANYSFQLYKIEKKRLEGNTVYCGATYQFSESVPRFVLGGNFLENGCYAGTDKFGMVFMSNYDKPVELVKAEPNGNLRQTSSLFLGTNLQNIFSKKVNFF